jgi:hypothetical protein
LVIMWLPPITATVLRYSYPLRFTSTGGRFPAPRTGRSSGHSQVGPQSFQDHLSSMRAAFYGPGCQRLAPCVRHTASVAVRSEQGVTAWTVYGAGFDLRSRLRRALLCSALTWQNARRLSGWGAYGPGLPAIGPMRWRRLARESSCRNRQTCDITLSDRDGSGERAPSRVRLGERTAEAALDAAREERAQARRERYAARQAHQHASTNAAWSRMVRPVGASVRRPAAGGRDLAREQAFPRHRLAGL